MKAKVGRGDGFRGVLDYALGKQKRAEIIGGTIAGLNARQLAAEFGMVRRLRPDAKRPVWHCSLSLPPGDHLTGERWDAVAADFMKEMGFSESTPYIAVRHRDTDKDHVHIIASRIDLSGGLWHGKWEARRAIEATQKLEKAHGLRLTPGLDASTGKKSLKKGEIEMSLRKEEQPPKLRLQNIINEALAGGDLTAVQFAETLELSGVEVKANLASTGRLNGFSFSIDGIAFKGSKLGKAYTLAGLLDRGVNYEQTRDYTSLARFASVKSPSSDQQPEAGNGAVTASIEPTPRGAFGAADSADPSTIRQDHRSATSEHTGAGRPDYSGSDQLITTTVADVERQDGHIEQHFNKGGESSGIFGKSPETNTGGDIENTRCSEPSESQSMVKNSSSSGSGSNSNSSPGGGWNARFKAASAKARDKRSSVDAAVGASNTGGTKFNARDLQATKQIDPLPFIERMGYSIKKDGRHFSIRHGKDEAYRLTCKPDGHWVWVDKYGSHGGDNIDLVRELSGLDRFIDCVYELNGGLRATPVPMPIPVAPKPPRIPPESSTGRMAGRMYLNDRGISDSTINHAEQSGFLRYLADGLLFVGYQAGKIWNATKRSIMPDAEIPKRDLAGSDKSKPQVLTGNPKTLWIVEGGVDALALHDIAKRSGKEPPTVIVSGGAGVLSFFDNPEIAEKIRAARLVVVAGENEKNAEVQAKTDAQHEAQLELVKALNPSAQAMLWKPESRLGSDIADYNLSIKSKREQQENVSLTSNVKASSRDM